MKLDDRPVIDQLLNPTPLNILADVREEMSKHLDGQQVEVAKVALGFLRDEIKELHLDLSSETLDQLDNALEVASDAIAEELVTFTDDAVLEMSERLEARL